MLFVSSICKAEEGGDAVASSTDDNAVAGETGSAIRLIINVSVHSSAFFSIYCKKIAYM